MADFESEEEYVTSKEYLKRMGEYKGERNELGERHGNGKATYDNGDVYEGQFSNGKRDGLGVYRFQNAKYTGSYQNSKRKGFGTMVYPDGSKYEGSWEDGKKNGEGVYYFPNGDKFEGEWNDDSKHGSGIYHYATTGSKFSARWVHGQQQGIGEWLHNDHKYRGEFKNELPDGRGKYIFNNGCEQHGYYANRDIVQQVGKRMELVGRQPVWHYQMLTHSMVSKK